MTVLTLDTQICNSLLLCCGIPSLGDFIEVYSPPKTELKKMACWGVKVTACGGQGWEEADRAGSSLCCLSASRVRNQQQIYREYEVLICKSPPPRNLICKS